jgi:hypothetical protein
MNRDGSIQRAFADAHGADNDALAEGFRWLFRVAEEGGYQRAAVFVPGVAQIESLGRVVGADLARELHRNRQIEVDGTTIALLIERKLPVAFEDGPILAVWVDDKQLDKIDGLRPPGICAIPWSRTDIDGWKGQLEPRRCSDGDARRE